MFERPMLIAMGYELKDRTFGEVKELIPGELLQRLQYADHAIMYSGAQHNGRPKKLNMTFLPNIHIQRGCDIAQTIFGSTFGHHQGVLELTDQEVYQYFGFGAMLFDYDSDDKIPNVELIVARPGEKIVVPSFCNMTMFNLGAMPLFTIDFANPHLNSSTKDLQRASKAMLHAEYDVDTKKVSFTLDRNYINREDSFGVHLGKVPEPARIELGPVLVESFGDSLYEIMCSNEAKEKFSELGITLKPASRVVSVNGLEIDGSLDDPTMSKKLHRAFKLV
ncbi:MAG: hypothetical protein ABIG30_03345 [Candidatus Aenigmatarchaeota archaeon]